VAGDELLRGILRPTGRRPHTERWFENTDLGLKGKVDLVYGPTHLLDYKSGTKKSATSIVKHSALDPPSDKPNFQALLYLTQHRTEYLGEELQFTFFHFLETLDDVVTGDGNLDDCLTTVTYHPVAFEEHIASRNVFTELQEDAASNCNKTFSRPSMRSTVRSSTHTRSQTRRTATNSSTPGSDRR